MKQALHIPLAMYVGFQSGPCGNSGGSVLASDGSGYTLVGTTNPSFSLAVYDRSGNKLPLGSGNSAIPGNGTPGGTLVDPDGVTMNLTSTSSPATYQNIYTYVDTLGQTAMTATVAHRRDAYGSSAPDTYTYTDVNGHAQTVQVNFTPYPLRTVFGCSGIFDATGATVYLPTSIVLPDGETFGLSYEPTPGYAGNVTGRLAKLTLPSGGYISYTYSGGNNGIQCTKNAWGNIATMARTVNDGNGHISTWQYTSSTTDANNNFTTTEIDPAGNTTTYNFHQWFPTRVVVTDASSGVLSATVTCYNGTNGSQSACITPQTSGTFYPITQKDVYTSLGTASPSLVQTQYNTYGSITAVKKWDVGAAYPPSGAAVSTTTTTYANVGGVTCGPVGTNIHDRPCTVATTNSAGTKVNETKYIYNSAGHATQISKWVSGTTYLTASAIWNTNGTMASLADPNGATTNYYYNGAGGCNGVLLTSTIFPINDLSTSQTWDCVGGVLRTTTDANGKTTTRTYDSPFWRLTETDFPDGGHTGTTYNTTSTPWTIETTQKIDSAKNLTTRTTLDGLGRTIKQELTSDPDGTVITDTVYDSLGRVWRISNPYRSTSDLTYGVTEYSYDALGRTTQIKRPDNNTVLYSYSGMATSIQDEGNGTRRVQRIYQNDGLGRLKSVCEVTSATLIGLNPTPASCQLNISGNGFLTTYEYDALNNLTRVVQGGLNNRNMTYDGLSRLTSETIPEVSNATVTYVYNSNGDLYQRIRPRANQTNPATTTTTTFSYDALHRVTGTTYSDGTPTMIYRYDESAPWGWTISNPKGRQTSQWTTDASSGATLTSNMFSYDVMGRRTVFRGCTPVNCSGTAYGTTYGYDWLGNITTFTNGWGIIFTQSYDSAARFTSMSSSANDQQHPGTLISGVHYNALGQMTSGTLGNGVGLNRTYNSRGLLTSASDGTVWSLTSVAFKPNSSISTANDSQNGNWSYTYDDFNRLKTATKPGQSFTYEYDRYGNRWQQNGGPGPLPQYTFDANNRIVSSGISYDAAGNVINDGVHSYTYDAENRMTAVDGGSTASYVYDAEGRRVQSVTASGTKIFIFDLAGRATAIFDPVNVNWIRGGIWSPIGYVATYANSTTYFSHTDWLGTVRARSNVSGGPAEGYTSLPFGDALSSIGLSPIHFTGKERDSESNLDHFWFRQYSSTQGRWMSPDPAGLRVVDPTNPQTWNRYTYVTNKPLIATDPLGLQGGIPYPLGPGYTLDGQGILDPTWSGAIRDFQESVLGKLLRSGGAIYCPDNNCSGIRATDGPNGSTVFERYTWVAPYTLYFDDITTISRTIGHWSWQTVGTNSSANNNTRVGMDIWNCPGCAATWRNASGAANTALVATGVVVGANGIAMVGPTIATAARPVLQFGSSIMRNPSFISNAADFLSGLTPASFVPASTGGFAGAGVGLYLGEWWKE